MFVEFIETLRCPRPHDETPLVASALRTEERHIVDGVLGCPVCGAEFTIADGVARFGEPETLAAGERPSTETAMRLAAFLELTDARGFALLFGGWGSHADQVRRLSDTPLLLVNPPATAVADVAAVLVTGDDLPLAGGSARAAALDLLASDSLIRSAIRAVKMRGRVLGPLALALPDGLTELVRDDRVWVAEKTAASDTTPRLVRIGRAQQ